MTTTTFSVSDLTVAQAAQLVGGLSKPSKMPGKGWGISAYDCKTGSKLRKVKGSTCSMCYALKGNYMFPVVRNAHAARLSIFNHLDRQTWIDAMAKAIGKSIWFRWFDSGDLQSVEMLQAIVSVAKKRPDVNFWLPTREKGMVLEYQRIGGKVPRNLTIRISAAMVDGKPPRTYGPINTSTVHAKGKPIGFKCLAASQDNECRDCRACWSRKVANVSYGAH